MMKLRHYTGAEIRAYRRRLNMTQTEFWCPLGATQSGGARYESGRDIPLPVQILINLVLDPERGDAMLNELRVELTSSRPIRRAPRHSETLKFSTESVDGAVDKRPAA